MPYDKIGLINDALVQTGNTPCSEGDGTPEWIAGNSAYERALPAVLYSHDWTFQTRVAALVRSGDSTYPGYGDVFDKPADCLHLMGVWRTEDGQSIVKTGYFRVGGEGVRLPQIDYDVIGDKIHTVAPNGASAKFVLRPNPLVVGDWPPGFIETLLRRMESYLAQGLGEDLESALALGKISELELAKARARVDQERPRRVAVRSRMLESRYLRRGV
jgi:hypothetical protein